MNLDSKIKKNKMPLTCFHTEEAKTLKGQKGYFADDMSAFQNLKRCAYGELTNCDCDSECPYWCKSDCINQYEFFLPEIYVEDEVNALKNKVKELEGKVIELQNKLNLETVNNPFTPWTNCCASINYPNGFNPQSNWCK